MMDDKLSELLFNEELARNAFDFLEVEEEEKLDKAIRNLVLAKELTAAYITYKKAEDRFKGI